MKLLSPTQHKGLNEATGFVLLFIGLFLWLSVVSYQAQDPSWNTSAGSTRALNLTGPVGSYTADLLLQTFGLASFAFPVLALLLAWKWLRSEPVEAPVAKIIGTVLFLLSAGAVLSLGPDWRIFGGTIRPGGVLGLVVEDYLIGALNFTGSILLEITVLIVSIYLISTFTMERLGVWFAPLSRAMSRLAAQWADWRERREKRKEEKAAARLEKKARQAEARREKRTSRETEGAEPAQKPRPRPLPPAEAGEPEPQEIPICTLADTPPWDAPTPEPAAQPASDIQPPTSEIRHPKSHRASGFSPPAHGSAERAADPQRV
jgi:S-DNA-T family DNA segregation ATPase FtsK/SpoIIIE